LLRAERTKRASFFEVSRITSMQNLRPCPAEHVELQSSYWLKPIIITVIHRVKWRHSNLWSQYDLYVVEATRRIVWS